MPADTVDWPWPTKMKREEGPPSHLISSMTCKYGDPFDTVTHHMQGWLVASECNFHAVQGRLLSGGALDCHSYLCVLYPQVHGDGVHLVWWFE